MVLMINVMMLMNYTIVGKTNVFIMNEMTFSSIGLNPEALFLVSGLAQTQDHR